MAIFEYKGKDIYYEDHGAGEPILLLNGILMSAMSWQEFVGPLSACNRLLLLDFLDQGQSAKMDGPYSQDIQVEVVFALLEHLGIGRTSVMGYSYGGKIALQLALYRPECIDRLLVFNATARTGPWLYDIGESWNRAAKIDGETFYLATIPIIYSPGFYERENAWLESRKTWLMPIFDTKEYREAISRLTDSGIGYDIEDRLGEIKAPTLIVSSEYDQLMPVVQQRLLAERIPNSQHVMVMGSGHATMYESPMMFCSLILGFLNNPKKVYSIK